MAIDLFIVAHKNICWRVKEYLKTAGYNENNFNVITRYPSEEEISKLDIPIIAIQLGNGIDYDKEISSEPGDAVEVIIDVFASVQSQLDSLLYNIRKNLRKDAQFLMYDMSTLEPTITGNYSGLSESGSFDVISTSWRKNQIIQYSADKREIYNGFIISNIKLPIV